MFALLLSLVAKVLILHQSGGVELSQKAPQPVSLGSGSMCFACCLIVLTVP